MKLVILGASGRTGAELVKQAVERGHTVTAVVRKPDAHKQLVSQSVTVIKADVTNAEQLSLIFTGHDAVLSGIGSNKVKYRLIERSSLAIITAMHTAGITRYLTVLSFGGAPTARFTKIAKMIISLAIGRTVIEQSNGAALIRQSQLDWTIVYATILTNGPLSKNVRIVGANEKISMQFSISRADVAFFMLNAAEQTTYTREQPVITKG